MQRTSVMTNNADDLSNNANCHKNTFIGVMIIISLNVVIKIVRIMLADIKEMRYESYNNNDEFILSK